MDDRRPASLRGSLARLARRAGQHLGAADPRRWRRWMLVALATLVSVLLLGAGFAVAAQTSADRRASAADRSPVADRQPAGGSASGTTLAVGPGGLTIPADLGRPREGRAKARRVPPARRRPLARCR